MSSPEHGGVDRSVELIACEVPAPTAAGVEGSGVGVSEEITPLLTQPGKPKINIFTISYPRRKPREQVIRSQDTEGSLVLQFISLLWSGSRYSGVLCMAVSSAIYFLMEIFSESFSAQPIPLYETAFVRSTIILILSYSWLRRSEQPFFEPRHIRKFLLFRALLGYLSLMGFIFCIQRLPLSQASVLSFSIPIMASIAARIILREKLRIGDIGGLACSFFGVLFIFQQRLTSQGGLNKAGRSSTFYFQGSQHIYAVLIGIFASITGGISLCCIRAASKDSGQPMSSVLSFSLLATPAAAISALLFEVFVLPSPYSLFLMVMLGLFAFFAELLLARALQLEKTSKAANLQFIEVALLQLWRIGLRQVVPSFGHLLGCLLILISAGCTIYAGPDKEMG
ncbi:hypothetical protein SAY87_020279 [Trapa incisa]|uniref:EamA domain-containing protein n=1 Tax=Trapa incisa TaxID=236973 RepID=A0AAN7K750_9MYRT|nr:hypothetical protein SAY87_020279 [Trapa incisa]